MKQITYKINDPAGIHARPAGLLVKECAKFNSNITVKKGEKSADAKKIFGVMGLGVKQGDTVELTIEGADEANASSAIEEFLKANL